MKIKTQGCNLKIPLMGLLSERSKDDINFTVKDGLLFLQCSSVITQDKFLSITVLEQDNFTSVTVTIDSSIELLSDKEDVILTFTDSLLMINQNKYDCTFEAVPIERFEILKLGYNSKGIMQIADFVSLNNHSKYLDGVARLFSVNVSPVHIKDNIGYVIYEDIALMQPIHFPDSSITEEALRKICPSIVRADTRALEYVMNTETGNVLVNIETGDEILFVIKRVDSSVSRMFEKMQRNMKYECTINLSQYKRERAIILRTYKKVNITLAFTNDSMGMYVDNAKSKVRVGIDSEVLFSIRTTSAHLLAINKLFGDESEIEVLRGENSICLYKRSTETKLFLCGMIY